MTGRYKVKVDEWGARVYDSHEDKHLPLSEVVGILNEYVPPKLPEAPDFNEIKGPTTRFELHAKDGSRAPITMEVYK